MLAWMKNYMLMSMFFAWHVGFIITPAAAEGVAPTSAISIELNAFQQQGESCRLLFVAANTSAHNIERLSLEAVLFDAKGIVDRFAVFDFQALPAGRTRVRQFDVAAMQCTDIGKMLINGVASCEGQGLEPSLCVDMIEAKSVTDMELLQ